MKEFTWPEYVEIPIRQLLVAQHSLPEVGALDLLMGCIEEDGICVPLIISKKHRIISGAELMLGALALGRETVPCLYCKDLLPEQIRQISQLHREQLLHIDWEEIEETLDNP